MAATKVLLDTGPLVGYLNQRDQYHAWAKKHWASLFEPLWTCESVLSEAIYLLQSDGLHPDNILNLVDSGIIVLDFVMEDHRADVFRLMRKYADAKMSLADACLVRMTELVDNCRVFTTDRDFLVYRRRGRHLIPVLAPFGG